MVNPTVRLSRPLGAGGMGAVWVAEHLALQTYVVVKFMAPELAKDPGNVQRFAREAAAASQVKSPHVVQMFDHGVSSDGIPFIVMELLEGHDLAHHLRSRGRLPPQEVAAIVTQTCKALSKAHEKGIVHRDIKPDNIFLTHQTAGDELFVKLLDFGIAKASGALSSHTGTGAMIGTPFYMSPEQIVGAHSLDFRTDIWALGIVTFEALTGQKPFEGDTIGGLAVKIHSGRLPMPSMLVPELPAAIDTWFQRACALEPEARFQSAKEMATSLAAAVGHASMVMAAPQLSAHVAQRPSPEQSGGWGVTPPPSQRPGVGVPPPPPPPPPHAPSFAQHPSFPQHQQQPSFPNYASSPGTHMASTSTPAPMEPRKSSKLPLVIGLIVLLLAGSAGGAFVMLRNSNTEEQPTTAGSAEEQPEAPAPKKKKKKKDVEEEAPKPEEPEPPATTTAQPPATVKKPPATATATATTTAPALPPPVKPTTTATATATATAPKPPPKKSNDDDIK